MISYRKYIEDGRLNLSVLSEHRGKALQMEENHRENFCLPVIYCSMLVGEFLLLIKEMNCAESFPSINEC